MYSTLTLIVFRQVLVISSSSFLQTWLGLEFALVRFIFLLKFRNSPSFRIILYFIVQSVGSLAILVRFFRDEPYDLFFIDSALLLKIGLGPFYIWVPALVSYLNWWRTFLLLTFIKIGPLVLLSLSRTPSYAFLAIGTLRAGLGAILGYTEIEVKKLVAFSSLSHMGWLLCAIGVFFQLWRLYILIYTLNLFVFTFTVRIKKIKNFNFTVNRLKTHLRLALIIASIGGAPPTTGFIMKWLVLDSLCSTSRVFWSLPLIIRGTLSIAFYLKLGVRALLKNATSLIKISKTLILKEFFLIYFLCPMFFVWISI